MMTGIARCAAFHSLQMVCAGLFAALALSGCPRVTPASIAFGNVPLGTSSAIWTVRIENGATASVTVGSIALTGTHRGDYALSAPATPLGIPPGETLNASVEFHPLALGTRTAAIEVAAGGAETPTTVPLTGQGAPKATGGLNYANDGSVVGTNLSPISDWSPEWAFLDCFKTSRAWFSGTAIVFQDSRTLPLDATGWVTSLQPGQYAKTLLFWAQTNTYPGGDYVVLYDGAGKLEYHDAATKISGTAGRDLVRVDAAKAGWQLWITETDPANYVRNIRVIMPGGGSPQDPYSWWPSAAACPYKDFQPFENTFQTLVFHPTFLKMVRNYKVLRFMDWMSTNNSTQQNWTDRPIPADPRWTAKGVPVEIMCRLANTLHADPWFCLPHMATDDYLRQFALAVRDGLAPDLHAYVEYSNEVWNGSFNQALYAQEQGLALKLSANPYTAEAYFTAQRSVQMFGIFGEVLGGTQRMKRVLATQAAGWGLGETEITYLKAYEQADVLAIAPYFGLDFGSPANERATQAMTVDQLFSAINSTALPQVYAWLDANAAMARKYGLELAAYEGGQSLHGYSGVENNTIISALFDAANRDPRMGQVYTNYLNAWKARGGGMFVHYLNCLNYTKWGRWGSLEHMGQTTANAPKYGAIQQYLDKSR